MDSREIPLPEAIRPLVDVLGVGMTVRFLIKFGGTELKIPTTRFTARSRVVELVGPERARNLIQNAHLIPRRIPKQDEWVAMQLLQMGHSTTNVARMVRVSDQTVRNYRRVLKTYLPAPAPVRRLPPPAQLDLFDK